jgi:hypothetical protein
MIKLETHCHLRGTSGCADTDIDLLIERYASAGYGGIVATNHFSYDCFDSCLKGDTRRQKIDNFFEVYQDFSKKCKEKNIRTFWGAEVRVKDERTSRGTEYVVLGLPKSAYYEGELLFNLDQKGLFELAEKHGAFMYQSHPFRVGVLAGNPKYLHGAEYFNGHYHHVNNNELAREFCRENNLIGLSGTDFHHKDQPITAGIMLPEEISNEEQLVKFLFDDNFTLIQEEEKYLSALKKHKGE